MGRSQETFSKKEKEKKKLKKRKDKEARREERRGQESDGTLDNMIAYVDEFGNISDTPPDPSEKEEIDAEDIVVGVPPKEEEDNSGEKTGKLDFFNTDKGYGFIKENGSGESYFVHVSEMLEEIYEGDKVAFELERGPKGMNAVRVKRV